MHRALLVIRRYSLKTACIDLCILAHTLDFSADPIKPYVRSIGILTQGGWVILCGFNSMSLTGLGRLYRLTAIFTLLRANVFTRSYQ